MPTPCEEAGLRLHGPHLPKEANGCRPSSVSVGPQVQLTSGPGSTPPGRAETRLLCLLCLSPCPQSPVQLQQGGRGLEDALGTSRTDLQVRSDVCPQSTLLLCHPPSQLQEALQTPPYGLREGKCGATGQCRPRWPWAKPIAWD